jgi:hypothetical protein
MSIKISGFIKILINVNVKCLVSATEHTTVFYIRSTICVWLKSLWFCVNQVNLIRNDNKTEDGIRLIMEPRFFLFRLLCHSMRFWNHIHIQTHKECCQEQRFCGNGNDIYFGDGERSLYKIAYS